MNDKNNSQGEDIKNLLRQADVAVGLGDLFNAIDKLKKALELQKLYNGEKSKEVCDTLGQLGDCYKKQHDYFTAYDLYQESLLILLENFSDKQSEIRKALKRTTDCQVLCQNVRTPGAAQEFDKHQALLKQISDEYGENSLVTAYALLDLGNEYLIKKENAAAKIAYNKALHVYQLTFGEFSHEYQQLSEKVGSIKE